MITSTSIGYRALHNWVERKLGVPSVCARCPRTSGRFHWANISGKYKRDVSDWVRLCPPCHTRMDRKFPPNVDGIYTCAKGHVLTEDNIYVHPTRRLKLCVKCIKERRKIYYWKLKEQ